MPRLLALLLSICFVLAACPMTHPLPRNMSLTAFDPHRQTFECRHEADHVPPIDPEADAWNQEALRLTAFSDRLVPRDYPRAVQLWTQAAARNHWKAMMNLASTLATGAKDGPFEVKAEPEHAVQIVERAMQLKIPAAFDLMGTFHQQWLGVNGDSSRAYAFWQLAAEMGNARAQNVIGDKLTAGYDDPKRDFWANRAIGVKMLECAFAQGHGPAARNLGLVVELFQNDYPRAMAIYHAGVMMGDEGCASHLFFDFNSGDLTVSGIVDKARAQRYRALANELYYNPDLRFPNLDKILPLPPAPLPKWDGNVDTLVAAAKGVVPLPPKPPANAASQRTGRAHIPDGFVLPTLPRHASAERYESTRAGLDGYWLPQVLHAATDRSIAWNAAQVPLRYAAHETFESARNGLEDADGRVVFRYLGEPVEQPEAEPRLHPAAARGIARAVPMPTPYLTRRGDATAPRSGIWFARVDAAHPRAVSFNHWQRQRYVAQGQAFPPLLDAPAIEPTDLTWYCCGQANGERSADWSWVRLNETDTFDW